MTVGVSCRGLVYIYRLEGYDVVALSGVDLDISPGEAVGLVGPSGSGKSTLLSVFAGLLPPSAGRLIIGDQDMTRASDAEFADLRATQVGVVLQGTGRNLLPYLSAEQNVRFAQRGASRRNRAEPREVLSLVGLSGRGRGRIRPGDLTPGERQRLALAVALANRPGLLLADEPTSQLDSRARDEVVAALAAVHAAGTTVVVVTHDPAVGAKMGRTVTIRDGRVGAEGRLGADYAVVGRDGSLHLPPEVLGSFPPGTLVEVMLEPDGSARLLPADGRAGHLHAYVPDHGAALPVDARALDYQGADQRLTPRYVADPRIAAEPRAAAVDPRADLRTADPRVDPRADPRVTDPRVADPRVADPRAGDGEAPRIPGLTSPGAYDYWGEG